MYINFAHFYIPKLCAFVSFLVNPYTIYIVWNDKKLHLGDYRYLLVFFAIFNVIVSIADCLVPWSAFIYRYAFSVVVVDGYFQPYTEFHQIVLGLRCSFISGTYGVLHSHYLYRFLVLFNNQFLAQYFVPYGLLAVVAYTLFHMVFWILCFWVYVGGDYDRRMYIRDALLKELGLDSLNSTLVIAQYDEGSYESIKKSWIGIGSMSILSIVSLVIIFSIGWKTIRKLKCQDFNMSKKTKRIQKQLMNSLIAQAIIPTCVSFAPCFFTWYQPVFNVNMGRCIYNFAVAAVALFPCLDPIALIVFVPAFRRQFYKTMLSIVPKKPQPPPQPETVSTSKL